MIHFDEPTHSYRIDGVAVPSVTELLAPMNDWSHVDAWALEAARCLGRDVHAAVNLMARGALNWKTLDPGIAPYVRGARRFLRESGGTVIAAEQRVASKLLRVAGTLDLAMIWDDWLYFIDWKVSLTVPSTVGAQLAGYQRLYEDTYRAGRKLVRARRLCVRLKPDDYSATRMNDLNGDTNLFIACLTTFQHRQRRSYA